MTDFPALLRCLSEAGVEYIVVGGAAATAHGSARLTLDLDVVYRRSRQNLDRLAGALGPHRPYLRGAPPGLPFQWEVRTLEQGLNFTLATDLGAIDLWGEIAGGGTYEALLSDCVTLEVFGITCRCLGLERLIRVKRAAELEAILPDDGSFPFRRELSLAPLVAAWQALGARDGDVAAALGPACRLRERE